MRLLSMIPRKITDYNHIRHLTKLWMLFVILIFLILVVSSLGQMPLVSIPAAKHVEIDKTRQILFAYEGDKLVFQTRVSTGRESRSTPSGDFTAGEKSPMHYSSLFHNAPMPYSVQVDGNIFIHGFAEVPTWPASHGCIRVPLDGDNPAKRFFEWVAPGTPIHITGQWNGQPKPALP